jgi:hypothetical protein
MSQWESEAGSAFTPFAAKSSAASSGMVMSSFSATRRKMKTRCGSSLLCRQPPSALGATPPRSPKAVIKLMTNDGDTLNGPPPLAANAQPRGNSPHAHEDQSNRAWASQITSKSK